VIWLQQFLNSVTLALLSTRVDCRQQWLTLEEYWIGTGYILKAFLPLAQQGSVAVCIASMAGHFTPRNPAYNSILKQPLEPDFITKMAPFVQNNPGATYGLSKLGVILMVEDQAWDWGQKGARIVSISPGTFDTPMGRQEAESQPK
jgi:NAD(P)-dependent dehydrogenase (short-subunit alcohol dehydrogenase family)